MNKKICVVGPSLQMGGMERESCNMANAFNKLGYQTLFLAIFNHPKFLYLNQSIEFCQPQKPTKKLKIVNTIIWIRQEIRNFNPEIILAYNTFYASLVLISTIGLKTKVYVRDGASPLFKWPIHVKLFFSLVFRFLSPAGVITQTEMAIPYQKKYYKTKVPIACIPNVLRTVELYNNINRENIILCVGRLNDPLKGFDQLISVIAKLKNKNWIIQIAGGGVNDAHELIALAESLKVKDRIIFLGKVENIDELYARAGIFVIPSRSEGYPNALCEAMAAGIPCVSFDFISGPKEIIEDGYNGYIIDNSNVEKMAEKIDYLIVNPVQRKEIGLKALKIREKLEESKITQQYLEFMI